MTNRTLLKVIGLFSLVISLLLFNSCSKDATSNAETVAQSTKEAPKSAIGDKPLTLKVYQYSGALTDEEFTTLMSDPVHKKYPNVTLELARAGKGSQPEDLVTAGTLPDIYYTGTNGVTDLLKLGMGLDLNKFIKQKNVDISQFEPVSMDFIKSYSTKGELFALPFAVNFSVIYYNKDLYDRFGAPYPTDNMTWSEAAELGKRLTRSEGGVDYRGLEIESGPTRLAEQLGLPLIDPKTWKVSINTDSWKKALLMNKYIEDNAGGREQVDQRNDFYAGQVGSYGSFGARLGDLEALAKENKGVNYDLAAMPIFPDAPKNAFGVSFWPLMLAPSGKNEEASFEIMMYLLSDDIQSKLSGQGRLPGLSNPKYKSEFGKDLVSFKGKNANAIFGRQPAPLPPATKYDAIIKSKLGSISKDIIADKTDVNTALRIAEEELNKQIEADLK